jgi:replicative DNA helicase
VSGDEFRANWSEHAERSILGAILRGSDYTQEILAAIHPREFYAVRHGIILSAAADLSIAGIKPDLITIRDALERTKKLQHVGGDGYLMEISDEHISDSGLDGHMKLIKDYAIIRIAARDAENLARMAKDGAQASEVVSEVVRMASELSEASTGQRTRIENPMATLSGILTNVQQTYMETGFGFVDDNTRICPENFIVIGARPAVGKSSFALGIAIAAAKQGMKVMFNCLEMSTQEMVESLMAHETRIKLNRIMFRELDPVTEFPRCREAVMACSGITFTYQKTVPELIAKARAMRANGGIDLLITDYLQKMIHPAAENRTQEVGYISRSHKELAMDFKIPVIGLSQLSRAGKEGKPDLSDLREAGDIEQDANAVYFLWRDQEDPGTRWFNIEKDRRGSGTPPIQVDFDGSIVRFSDRKW